MGKGSFCIFLDDFEVSTKNGTMDHAKFSHHISNLDISIHFGYHGNLKNVSFIENLAY